MRTDLVRLVVTAALLAASGCGGGGGGAPGATVSGAAAAAAAGAGAAAAAGVNGATAICGSLPCTLSLSAVSYTVNVTLPASFNGISASGSLQDYLAAGAPSAPIGSTFILSANVILSGPAPASGSPTITITSSSFPIARKTITEAIVDSTGATVDINGTQSAGSATIPSLSTYVWPTTATTTGAVLTIYVM